MNARALLTFPLLAVALLAAAVAPRLTAAPGAPEPPTPLPEVPPGEIAVTATLEADRTQTDAHSRELQLRVDLVGAERELDATPTDLVVVLDRSGSMSGPKMDDARAATGALAALLGAEDRFALVSFSGDARIDVPLSSPPPDRWSEVIGGIVDGGSTNMADGLRLASDVARRAPGRSTRVVLVSDGEPDDRSELRDLARALAVREIPLTAVGIGDDWNEDLMASLADVGTGNLHWVQRGQALEAVLAEELAGSRSAVAQAAELEVDGPFTIVDAGGFPTDGKHVRLGQVLAGQRRGLWLRVRLDEGAPGTVDLGALELSWTTPAGATGDARLAAPSIEVVEDARVAWSALGQGWADSVVGCDWQDLRKEVAEQVRRGDREAAVRAIDGYRAGNELKNAYAQNAVVEDNLGEALRLREEVEAQFEGADQQLRQNQWAKTARVSSAAARKGSAP